jgi:DnaJ-class molecular chaperone
MVNNTEFYKVRLTQISSSRWTGAVAEAESIQVLGVAKDASDADIKKVRTRLPRRPAHVS